MSWGLECPGNAFKVITGGINSAGADVGQCNVKFQAVPSKGPLAVTNAEDTVEVLVNSAVPLPGPTTPPETLLL